MARVSTYLNFLGNTEEAFEFYRSVFGGEFTALNRMDGVPGVELGEADRSKIMHIALPIIGDHTLMGTDLIESMGHELRLGNNVSIALEPDSLDQGIALHRGLSAGATEVMELAPAPWGGYFGQLVDRFGIRWMFNVLQ